MNISVNLENRNTHFNVGQLSIKTKEPSLLQDDKNEKVKGDSVTISKKGLAESRMNNLAKMKQEKIKQKAELMSTPLGQTEAEAKVKQAKLEMIELEIETLQTDIENVLSESNLKKVDDSLVEKEKAKSKANMKTDSKEDEMSQMNHVLKAAAEIKEAEIAVSAGEEANRDIRQLEVEMNQDKKTGFAKIVTRESVEIDGEIVRKSVETTGIKAGSQQSMERKANKIAETMSKALKINSDISEISEDTTEERKKSMKNESNESVEIATFEKDLDKRIDLEVQ